MIGVALAAVASISTPAHSGDIAHETVVSENPADDTPQVLSDSEVSNPAVLALAKRRGSIFAGGSFRSVSDGSDTASRHHIMKFSAATGALASFAPVIDGPVWAIEPYRKALFIGGDFTHVNGVPRPGLVKVSVTNGRVMKRFDPAFASGTITELQMARGRLIAGGDYRGKLKALRPKTGRDTGYLDLRIAGRVARNAGSTDVYRFAVSPDRRRLVAIGNFTSVAGVERWRAVMLNLGKKRARLNAWSYEPLQRSCAASSLPNYLKDVDFSPDGSYFVLVSTGYVPQAGGLGTDVCDAAARFNTGVRSPSAPVWINYTGGDTLHSVAVTGAAVYVQGHQRWLDNPEGRDSAGTGAVDRPGIGAIDPDTGRALPWNPGKSRGVGGKDLLATRTGLWVGSDGAKFNGELRRGLAFCPLPQ